MFLKVIEKQRSEQDSDRGGKSYLEEAWWHGTAWHGVVRGHVAHHWAGRCCCALKHTNMVIKCGVLCERAVAFVPTVQYSPIYVHDALATKLLQGAVSAPAITITPAPISSTV